MIDSVAAHGTFSRLSSPSVIRAITRYSSALPRSSADGRDGEEKVVGRSKTSVDSTLRSAISVLCDRRHGCIGAPPTTLHPTDLPDACPGASSVWPGQPMGCVHWMQVVAELEFSVVLGQPSYDAQAFRPVTNVMNGGGGATGARRRIFAGLAPGFVKGHAKALTARRGRRAPPPSELGHKRASSRHRIAQASMLQMCLRLGPAVVDSDVPRCRPLK